MTVQQDNLETISKIGRALWQDPDLSERNALDTLAAVSLLDLTEERTLEKTSRALIERAKGGGVAANAIANSAYLFHPFFRLTPEQRVVLVALHCGKWSYERLGRVLGLSLNQVQELAWNARLHLCRPPTYPVAPFPRGASCPDYDPQKPWTQRFLDNEVTSGGDLFFLKTHILSCKACATCVATCRKAYYSIDHQITTITRGTPTLDFDPWGRRRTLWESLIQFSRRWDVKLMLGLLAWMVLLKIRSGL